MEVNEEIVKQWLHICKEQFTLDDIRFKVYGPKGGSNYSNIDFLAVDTMGHYFDYEIKWRSVYSISSTDKETIDSFIHQVNRQERAKKIKEIIGHKPYKKIFITTYQMFGQGEKKRERFIQIFKSHNIEVLFFEDVIKELIASVGVEGRYDSQILQTIRMLKYFELLK